MANENITIVINLDEQELKKSFKKVDKLSKKAGQEAGESFEEGIKKGFNEETESSIDGVAQKLDNLATQVKENGEKIGNSLNFVADNFGALATAGSALVIVGKNFQEVTTLAKDLFDVFFRSGGLFGLVSSLTAVGGALVGIGSAIAATDSQFAKFTGTLIKVAGILVGGLGAALGFAIVKASELAFDVGTKLVSFFDNAAKSFNKAEQGLLIFGATVDNFNRVTDNGIGSTESWNKEINKLSDSLNLSQSSLQKAAQEIVQVGSQLGLQEQQLKKVLKVSAEYAKVNRKDVFQTTLAVVNALNGNSQALQAYGVKLNQASVQAFAFRQGLTKNLNELSQSEQVQLRYNKLLKSYKNIAGIGATAAATLADQQTRLKINVERLNTALGAGARIIENNGLVAGALNLVLNNVNDTVLQVAGFLGALGARFLQVGGLIVGFSFKIFALVKGIKLLNVVLSSQAGINAFNKQLPFLNQSLNQLITNLSGVQTEVKGLSSLLKSLANVAKSQGDVISRALFGISSSSLTAGKALKGLFRILSQGLKKAAIQLAAFLAPFAPIIAGFAAIGAAIFGVVRLFQLIERKTGAFRVALEGLSTIFTDAGRSIAFVKDPLQELGNVVLTGLSKAVGAFAFAFATAFGKIFEVLAKDPFGIISKDAKTKLVEASMRLKNFSTQLKEVGFDFRRIPDEASRGIAGVNNSLAEINLEQLAALRKEFEDFGKTDLQKLDEQTQARLELINNALAQELLTIEQFEELKSKILLDASQKRFQQLNASAIAAGKQITRTLQNGLVRGVVSATSKLGEALAGGQFSFKAFVGTILGIIGDLLIQLSGSFIAIGLGVEAIKASVVGLSAGPALAAGLALALLGGALKAFSGQLGGEQSNIGQGPAPGSLSGGTPSDIAEAGAPETDTGPQTAINLTVQGDILDSEESGSRIINLINDSFDQEGVVVSDNARFA